MENDVFYRNVMFCCYFLRLLHEMLTAKQNNGTPQSNDVQRDDPMSLSCRSDPKTHKCLLQILRYKNNYIMSDIVFKTVNISYSVFCVKHCV